MDHYYIPQLSVNVRVNPPYCTIRRNRPPLLVMRARGIAPIDGLAEDPAAIVRGGGPVDGEAAAVGHGHLQGEVLPAADNAAGEDTLGRGAPRDIDVVQPVHERVLRALVAAVEDAAGVGVAESIDTVDHALP